jgi:hypothetical protein
MPGIERTPGTFPQARLLAKDFDGTVAQTFEKSPSGVGVLEAYNFAVEEIFGIKGLDEYLRQGGLKNRAPLEVVKSLAPEAYGIELEALLSLLIEAKLGVLTNQIGERLSDGAQWPRPMPGYLEFRETLQAAREQEGRLIDDLLLSSGHVAFIEKVYEIWGTGQPTHIVAEETMHDFGVADQVKPSPVLMDIAQRVWQEGYNLHPAIPPAEDVLDRTIYVGDDPVKDGQLAEHSGVKNFQLIDPETSVEVWAKTAQWLQIDHTAVAISGITRRHASE